MIKDYRKKAKLTEKRRDELWGETGPYSQAHLIKQVRILNDSVSRVFLIVEVDINPTTFELVLKHRHDPELINDVAIQQLLDSSEDRRPFSGYVSMAFEAEYVEATDLADAEIVLNRARDTIIKMHRFTMVNFALS